MSPNTLPFACHPQVSPPPALSLTLLAAFLACVMSCRILTMFSDTVAFLFLLFSRLLSFSSSRGMVLSRLDTGVGRGARRFGG